MTLTITRGLPGAGKTTWARLEAARTGAVRVNRDDMRMMLYGRKVDLGHDQEKSVTDACHEVVALHLRAGRSVIADDTNLRPVYVREWRKLAAANGAELEICECPVEVSEAIARQAQRPEGDQVPAAVIERMSAKYLPRGAFLPVPLEVETDETPARYEPVPGAPSAVLCDIDGTVALMNGRSPYDTSRVGTDLPNQPILDLLNVLAYDDIDPPEIIFMSGRDEECRADTLAWLARQGHSSATLFMRPHEDRRRDAIVKRELFDAHVRHQYNVWLVLDDRTQVVRMWRSLGLTCLQVADGDF